jgi:hypothetical protein
MVVQRGRLSGREAVCADHVNVEAVEPGGVRAKEDEGEGVARTSLKVRGTRRVVDEEGRRVELLLAVTGVKLILRVFVLFSGVGVLEPWKLLFLLTSTTLLAGELPGVSRKLLPIDLSLDMTVETESRSCRSFASMLISSSTSSMSRTSSCSADHRRFMSDCNRRISPFTVNLSKTPLSMMARTRSIAGP